MNLNQVTVPAKDINVSVAFYQRLGLELIVHEPHYARFKCPDGDATFSIHVTDKLEGNSNIVVYFETPKLDTQYARLRKEGVEFQQGPRDENWLWREARLLDPAGNTICLYWAGENRLNPPWCIKKNR